MGPITSPDETIARIALYVGVPALTVVFLYTVYVIYQWFQAAIKGIEYAITAKDWWNNTIKGRLRSGSSSLGGILAGIIYVAFVILYRGSLSRPMLSICIRDLICGWPGKPR